MPVFPKSAYISSWPSLKITCTVNQKSLVPSVASMQTAITSPKLSAVKMESAVCTAVAFSVWIDGWTVKTGRSVLSYALRLKYKQTECCDIC